MKEKLCDDLAAQFHPARPSLSLPCLVGAARRLFAQSPQGNCPLPQRNRRKFRPRPRGEITNVERKALDKNATSVIACAQAPIRSAAYRGYFGEVDDEISTGRFVAVR
jgi:hypothetical protein